MQVSGNTFLISGGGSGLGAATASLLASAGANVVIADVNRESGNKIASDIGEKATFIETDICSEEAVSRAVQTALDRYRGLHGVVNCAGVGLAEKTVGKDGPHRLDSFARIIQINLIGTFNVIRLAANVMSAQPSTTAGERGVIINTASVAAYDGQIGQAAYSASKGGIVGMTLPIARDLARNGIRVVTIAPGIFETPLLGTLPETVRQALGAQVPFPSRLGRPDEYAALAQHIIENEMLNGEVIRLDGALRMPPK